MEYGRRQTSYHFLCCNLLHMVHTERTSFNMCFAALCVPSKEAFSSFVHTCPLIFLCFNTEWPAGATGTAKPRFAKKAHRALAQAQTCCTGLGQFTLSVQGRNIKDLQLYRYNYSTSNSLSRPSPDLPSCRRRSFLVKPFLWLLLSDSVVLYSELTGFGKPVIKSLTGFL